MVIDMEEELTALSSSNNIDESDDIDDLLPESNDIIQLHFEAETLNPSSKRTKRPWQASYLDTFPWLRYDIVTKTAYCSYKDCDMYYIFIID